MRRAEQMLEDLRRALGAGDGLRRVALRQPHLGQADESPGGPLVVGPEAAFPDLERAPRQRSRPRRSAPSARSDLGQVPHRQADVGIVGVELLLLHRERAAEQRLGAAGVALLRQHFAQRGERDGGLGRLGP